MDRNLLNVEFDKTIKLKKVKYNPEKTFTDKAETKFFQNVAKLIYFLVLLLVLVFGAKLAIEYTYSYIRDEPHKDIIQIYKDFQGARSE